MEALKKALVVLVALAILAVAAFFLLTDTRLQRTATEAPPGGEADLANGERVFVAGNCASCHATPNQDDPRLLGGGRELTTGFGTFVAPNISPSRDGIFGWTTAQFVRAMRAGVSPDGRHYYPAFPYTSYQRMRPEDARDLHAYLITLPEAEGRAPDHDLAFPFSIRRGIGLWKWLALDGQTFDEAWTPPPGADEELAAGAYLVQALAHCAECHSPRNALGMIVEAQRYAGGPNPDGRGFVPNITPHETGIGGWTRAEIVEVLTSGFTPDFDVIGGHMALVVDNTSQLTEADRQAIAAYLMSLEPRPESTRNPSP